MVNARHDGTVLLQLGPGLQACPEELLRQRPGPDGRPEYLVRWSVVSSEQRAAGGGSAEPEAENISLWMSAEELRASCPALLGPGRPRGPRGPGREEAPGPWGTRVPPDEASLREMEADVGSLVRRARRQLAEAGAPGSSVLSTLTVLGAYAGMGSLAGAFRETGALELLLTLLCHQEKRIRRGAGQMLRALGAHDAGGGCSRSGGRGCRALGTGERLGSSVSAGKRGGIGLGLPWLQLSGLLLELETLSPARFLSWDAD